MSRIIKTEKVENPFEGGPQETRISLHLVDQGLASMGVQVYFEQTTYASVVAVYHRGKDEETVRKMVERKLAGSEWERRPLVFRPYSPKA